MQGRLVPPEAGRFQSFPRDGWRREFPRAAQAGLDSIEWIYDVFGESQNPLSSDSGIAEMQALADRHGVAVASVCADYFMDRPITRADGSELREILARLHWLFGRCAKAGIERMVLPFVDASRMRDAQDRHRVVDVLHDLVPIAEREGVEVHLETDLAPAEFAALLGRIEHPAVKVNYDSGNSASLGFVPAVEFAAYGPRIGSVHIKDRVLGGGTVALGSGDADLEAVFAGLRDLDYRGDYILQAARGEPGNEVALAATNRGYIFERRNGITAEPIASA
jgi:hexulose-6-phosphate isomerase